MISSTPVATVVTAPVACMADSAEEFADEGDALDGAIPRLAPQESMRRHTPRWGRGQAPGWHCGGRAAEVVLDAGSQRFKIARSL